jgi:hypothetical protein
MLTGISVALWDVRPPSPVGRRTGVRERRADSTGTRPMNAVGREIGIRARSESLRRNPNGSITRPSRPALPPHSERRGGGLRYSKDGAPRIAPTLAIGRRFEAWKCRTPIRSSLTLDSADRSAVTGCANGRRCPGRWRRGQRLRGSARRHERFVSPGPGRRRARRGVMWQVTGVGWVYIVRDTQHGNGIVAMAVSNIEEATSALEARGASRFCRPAYRLALLTVRSTRRSALEVQPTVFTNRRISAAQASGSSTTQAWPSSGSTTSCDVEIGLPCCFRGSCCVGSSG